MNAKTPRTPRKREKKRYDQMRTWAFQSRLLFLEFQPWRSWRLGVHSIFGKETTMPAPLDYSQQPRRRSPFRLTPRKMIVLCLLLFGLAVFLRGGPLTSADIRLDTGDLRYR
jgi:hypothetical protein